MITKYAIQQKREWSAEWLDVDVFHADSNSEAVRSYEYLRDQFPNRYGDSPVLRLIKRQIVTTDTVICR